MQHQQHRQQQITLSGSCPVPAMSKCNIRSSSSSTSCHWNICADLLSSEQQQHPNLAYDEVAMGSWVQTPILASFGSWPAGKI